MVTGGAGFIGSQLARSLNLAGYDVVVLDGLRYAGRRANLVGVPHKWIEGDICDAAQVRSAMKDCDAIVHAAAESHVCRAHQDPAPFVRTNIDGTRILLQEAERSGINTFIHISTDEVFGESRDQKPAGLSTPFRPGNAYAASKVGAEAMVSAWRHSYGFPAVIVRCTNNFGPRQHPEKAIPCWTLAALSEQSIPYDGAGLARRDWLYVQDFTEGLVRVLQQGPSGRTWHFAGRQLRRNIDVVQAIAKQCGVETWHSRPDRPGQDSVYLLDDEPTRNELGWAPRVSFEEGLERVIDWYRKNPNHWN